MSDHWQERAKSCEQPGGLARRSNPETSPECHFPSFFFQFRIRAGIHTRRDRASDRSAPELWDDAGCFDVVELGEVLFQVRITELGDGVLGGTTAVRRSIAVIHVEVHDVLHALDHFAEWCEALRVKAAAVITEIDEDLRGSRVRPSHCKNDGADLIAYFRRVIFNVPIAPLFVDLRIAVETPLHDEPAQHAEKAVSVVKFRFRELIKTISADWRPIAVNQNEHIALASLKTHFVLCRRRV